MARIKYIYNNETCKYEKVRVTRWEIFLNFLSFLGLALILAIGLVYVYSNYSEFPYVKKLKYKNETLQMDYEILQEHLKATDHKLSQLRDRDDNIYRKIFEADPLPESVWKGGMGGVNQYQEIMDDGLEEEELILSTLQHVDKLKRQMYIQTKSYDDILDMVDNREEMLASIPSIKPITNKTLKHTGSIFGMRWHPILHINRIHEGLDFSADKGTPVLATGNATVVRAGISTTYGKVVYLDHGYGYQTRYAHLSKIKVKMGEKVKRGAIIGLVGDTGLSEGNHLHYEVLKDNIPVNPVYYFYPNITDEEFEQLMQTAELKDISNSKDK